MIMIGKLAVLLVVFFVLTIASSDVLDNEVNGCNLPTELKAEIASYGPTVNRIIDALTNGKFKGGVYNDLANFVDKFGARLSGTKNLENSIDYMLDLMKNRSLENVHGEHAMIPHWQRGDESGELLEPRKAKIGVLSLGSSVGTPSGSIQAEVLVVRSFEELEQANFSQAAKGKIVVFNFQFESYGKSVAYRGQGATQAAKHGAVAALIKSVTPYSQYTLHTGEQQYGNNVTKIPAVSITVEDARMLQRYQDRGQKIVIKLKTHTHSHPDSPSRNVVGEIVGSAKPEKIVLVSGHIDSWDVGVGAMDDGGGAFISWYALNVLKSLGLRARRTIRSVLWTAEEPGLIGAQAYNKAHASELKDHIFVMESDEGTFTPLGIEYNAGPKGGCIIQEILKLLSSINTTQSSYADAVGSDITIWAGQIPGGSLLNDNDKYFYYHHSAADTMDVLDPDSLDKATALWASVAFIIADLKDEFPRDFKKDTLNDSVLLKKLKNSSQQRPRSPL
ncbi:carboxypeptidase Q [Leptinotarsa decemlineata]|uniref:carboxypeptidase Q n=1 Tax=Leptinotarsa decemlineata TaxID=7539 RepID=UPI003D30830E